MTEDVARLREYLRDSETKRHAEEERQKCCLQAPPGKIGMTPEEVIGSQWGYPSDPYYNDRGSPKRAMGLRERPRMSSDNRRAIAGRDAIRTIILTALIGIASSSLSQVCAEQSRTSPRGPYTDVFAFCSAVRSTPHQTKPRIDVTLAKTHRKPSFTKWKRRG